MSQDVADQASDQNPAPEDSNPSIRVVDTVREGTQAVDSFELGPAYTYGIVRRIENLSWCLICHKRGHRASICPGGYVDVPDEDRIARINRDRSLFRP